MNVPNCSSQKMKSFTELAAFAKHQKLVGKTDVAEFVLNRGSRFVAEVLHTAWDMENFQESLVKKKTISGYSCFMIL